MWSVDLPADTAADIVAALRADPSVARVERDRTRVAEGAPSDPGYGDQWSLPMIGWNQVYGSVHPAGSSVVAVLDTGVDGSQPDLAGQLVGGTSILDGSNGLTDPNGHGTWMAGIVAARTDNGSGIAGVGYEGVRVMPVTVLGADGTGQDSDVIGGVVYAVAHGADVILMSFSNPGYSASLQAALDYAWSYGVVLVAATGNDGSSTTNFPAGDRGVIGVSNTNQNDNLDASSNYGADTFLGAPGTDILTTSAVGGTTSITGTSAAAAEVAAAAALLRAADGSLSNGVIVGRLARTADAAGTVDQTGNGRLNLARALGDTSTAEVQPAGAAPVGSGGPFVGPYVVAANVSGMIQGQNNPVCVSPSPCPWQTTNMSGWGELQTAPIRLFLPSGQQNANATSFSLDIDRSAGGSQGLESLQFVSKTPNVTMSAIVFSASTNGSGATTWTYTFTVSMTDNNAGEIDFTTRLLAGAHAFTGNSLQIKGAGTLSFVKPAAAPGTPDLTLTKSALTAVAPGQTMTYTLSYRNVASGAANNATGVQITDVLPSQLTYVANSCTGCVYDSLSRSLSWDLSTIGAGSALATKTYQVTVGSSVLTNTSFSNNARILSSQDDATPANNLSAVTTTVFTPSISGTAYDDLNGNTAPDVGEPGLAGVEIKVFRDSQTSGVLAGVLDAADPQVGSAIVTPVTGEWAFTVGLAKSNTYFVVRTPTLPTGYTSTNAINETVAVGTDHSTTTKVSNDQLRVVFDSSTTNQYSSNNALLSKVALANQTITFVQPATPATYGSTFNVNPTSDSGLPVTVAASGGCSVVAATSPATGWDVTMTSSSTACVLTASQAGNASYNAAPNVSRTVVARQGQPDRHRR